MLNVVVLEGRLTSDPEERTAGEKKVNSFTIAHDTGVKDGDGKSIAEFFDVVAFEVKGCDLIHKGDRVAITGVLKNRVYTKKDGSKAHQYEIIATRINFIDLKKQVEESAE